MALDDEQRAWLDAAIKAKGRFTRQKAIEQDWEKYRRRRAKVATYLDSMGYDSPMRPAVVSGLSGADALAQAHKFSEAYKSLNSIKAQAKAGSTGSKAGVIAASQLRSTVALIRTELRDITTSADFAVSFFDKLLADVNGRATCAEQKDMETAFRHRETFVDTVEPVLMAELASRQEWIKRVHDTVFDQTVTQTIAAAREQIKTYEQAGLASAIQAEIQELAALEANSQSNGGLYIDDAVLTRIGRTMTQRVKERIAEIKALTRFQTREGDSTEADAATQAARGGLKPTPNARLLEQRSDDRLSLARGAMLKAGLSDKALLADTARGPIKTVRELPQFDAGLVFDDLLGDQELPDDLPVQQALELIDAASKKLRAVLTGMNAKDPALTHLLLQNPQELARMCSQALTGIDSPDGLSRSHASCFAQMAQALMAEIARHSPNRMSADKSSITLGGVKYEAQGELGKSKATVRQYVDPITGKAVAVKSMPADKRQELADEMRTHMRLMNDDPNAPGAANLLAMNGAVISDDGMLHMVMEVAEAGDMEKVQITLRLMEDAGLLPNEARQALAQDMLRQTVMGMKAMEARGLVHNDMKPANVLLTPDGTIKIMDFGESRIGDAQGNTPSQKSAKFGITPGYDAPEQQQVKAPVNSKVDSFALGGMLKVLGLDVDSQTLQKTAVKQMPVSSLARMAEALMDDDPDKRPSLNAVLLSAYMSSGQDDHPPEDVSDLKAASMQMSMAIGSFKSRISAAEFAANRPKVAAQGFRDLAANDFKDEVPLALMKMSTFAIDEELKALRKAPAQNQAAIDALQRKRQFWEDKVKEAVDARRQAGRQEMEALKNAPSKTLRVGPDNLSAKDALALREKLAHDILSLQKKFYETATGADPGKAAALVEQVNKMTRDKDEQIRVIDAGLLALLGADGRFFIAEQKLVEVSARFGPRKKSADDLAAA